MWATILYIGAVFIISTICTDGKLIIIPTGVTTIHKDGLTHEITKYVLVPDNDKEVIDNKDKVPNQHVPGSVVTTINQKESNSYIGKDSNKDVDGKIKIEKNNYSEIHDNSSDGENVVINRNNRIDNLQNEAVLNPSKIVSFKYQINPSITQNDGNNFLEADYIEHESTNSAGNSQTQEINNNHVDPCDDNEIINTSSGPCSKKYSIEQQKSHTKSEENRKLFDRKIFNSTNGMITNDVTTEVTDQHMDEAEGAEDKSRYGAEINKETNNGAYAFGQNVISGDYATESQAFRNSDISDPIAKSHGSYETALTDSHSDRVSNDYLKDILSAQYGFIDNRSSKAETDVDIANHHQSKSDNLDVPKGNAKVYNELNYTWGPKAVNKNKKLTNEDTDYNDTKDNDISGKTVDDYYYSDYDKDDIGDKRGSRKNVIDLNTYKSLQYNNYNVPLHGTYNIPLNSPYSFIFNESPFLSKKCRNNLRCGNNYGDQIESDSIIKGRLLKYFLSQQLSKGKNFKSNRQRITYKEHKPDNIKDAFVFQHHYNLNYPFNQNGAGQHSQGVGNVKPSLINKMKSIYFQDNLHNMGSLDIDNKFVKHFISNEPKLYRNKNIVHKYDINKPELYHENLLKFHDNTNMKYFEVKNPKAPNIAVDYEESNPDVTDYNILKKTHNSKIYDIQTNSKENLNNIENNEYYNTILKKINKPTFDYGNDYGNHKLISYFNTKNNLANIDFNTYNTNELDNNPNNLDYMKHISEIYNIKNNPRINFNIKTHNGENNVENISGNNINDIDYDKYIKVHMIKNNLRNNYNKGFYNYNRENYIGLNDNFNSYNKYLVNNPAGSLTYINSDKDIDESLDSKITPGNNFNDIFYDKYNYNKYNKYITKNNGGNKINYYSKSSSDVKIKNKPYNNLNKFDYLKYISKTKNKSYDYNTNNNKQNGEFVKNIADNDIDFYKIFNIENNPNNNLQNTGSNKHIYKIYNAGDNPRIHYKSNFYNKFVEFVRKTQVERKYNLNHLKRLLLKVVVLTKTDTLDSIEILYDNLLNYIVLLDTRGAAPWVIIQAIRNSEQQMLNVVKVAWLQKQLHPHAQYLNRGQYCPYCKNNKLK